MSSFAATDAPVAQLTITPEPIFVLGAPRSGTSMMQWALRQHPDLWGGPESDFLIPLLSGARAAHAYGTQRGDLHWLSRMGVGEAELLRYVGAGINAMYTQRSGGLRWVEQTPQYTLHLDEMSQAFPGARFVYMLRNGRDVVNSMRNFVYPVEHAEASRIWAEFVRAGIEFSEGPLGDRMIVVPYADAVQDAAPTLAALLQLLGLRHVDDCARFITDKAPINSSFQGGERRIEWSEDEEYQFDTWAGDTMRLLGFE
ncbi:MAG: sulfotransferase [Acidimicrobiales bacterium]|nr:sulfotransferase [Acidimicrobiales bacterium]